MLGRFLCKLDEKICTAGYSLVVLVVFWRVAMRTNIRIDSDNVFRRRAKEKDELREELFGKDSEGSHARQEHFRQCAEHKKRLKIGKPAFFPKF